jgi:hypothetical protein
MENNEIKTLFLWIIEEQLRLSRLTENTQQALRLALAGVGSIPPEMQQQLDSLLTAHRSDDLLHALSQAARHIREKSESGVPPLPTRLNEKTEYRE